MASRFEKEPNDLKPYVKIDLESADSQTSAEPDEERAESATEQEESTEELVQLRRSTRECRRPDFYGTYVNATDSVVEPVTVEEALSSVDKEKWKSAMEVEFKSLQSNEVWELVETPKDARVVNCKLVFKCKLGEDGSIVRHKAHLVAQGYSQRPGLDYKETFSPVARFESVRAVELLAAQMDLKIHQQRVARIGVHESTKRFCRKRQREDGL